MTSVNGEGLSLLWCFYYRVYGLQLGGAGNVGILLEEREPQQGNMEGKENCHLECQNNMFSVLRICFLEFLVYKFGTLT